MTPRRATPGSLAIVPFAAAVAICVAGFLAAGPSIAQEKVPVPGTDRYQVRYPDGSVSANDICPVLKRGLGVKKLPVWVNGQPVGFC